ncbi:hypothetical protein LOAG_14830, partial [Loa loa]
MSLSNNINPLTANQHSSPVHWEISSEGNALISTQQVISTFLFAKNNVKTLEEIMKKAGKMKGWRIVIENKENKNCKEKWVEKVVENMNELLKCTKTAEGQSHKPSTTFFYRTIS